MIGKAHAAAYGVTAAPVQPAISCLKAVDGAQTLPHKSATMMISTKRTTTTKKLSGALGGVRA
jgi:hypothetical protein